MGASLEEYTIGRTSLYQRVFLLAVFAKQLYILPSGSFQLGDLLFALSFFVMMSQGWQGVKSIDRKVWSFVVCACVIDGLYFLFYGSQDFLRTISYYIFNLLVIFVFREAMLNFTFLKKLSMVLKLALLFQLAVYLSGRGRWYMDVRYEGTFNDPNQYGFFVVSSFLMIAVLSQIEGNIKKSLLWYGIALFLIFPCASTGMLFGMIIFIVCYVVFSETGGGAGMVLKLIAIAILTVVVLQFSNGAIQLPDSIANSFLVERTLGKLQTISSGNTSLAKDRGWEKVFNYPWCMIYGAGEGSYWRFNSGGEVHSTVLGLLWCYGIVPFGILVSWIRNNTTMIRNSVWCVYIALIAEAMTLVNHRQPVFWMLFVIADHFMMKKCWYEAFDE